MNFRERRTKLMSKTIKIIDLLNKIANGEEFPKKVKFEDKIYTYYNEMTDYKNEGYFLFDMISDGCVKDFLNDKVEIIEEQEEIDKLEIDDNGFIHTNNGAWKGRKLDVEFAKAINKLADEIKNIKEK
jgi:hypothetical protein